MLGQASLYPSTSKFPPEHVVCGRKVHPRNLACRRQPEYHQGPIAAVNFNDDKAGTSDFPMIDILTASVFTIKVQRGASIGWPNI